MKYMTIRTKLWCDRCSGRRWNVNCVSYEVERKQQKRQGRKSWVRSGEEDWEKDGTVQDILRRERRKRWRNERERYSWDGEEKNEEAKWRALIYAFNINSNSGEKEKKNITMLLTCCLRGVKREARACNMSPARSPQRLKTASTQEINPIATGWIITALFIKSHYSQNLCRNLVANIMSNVWEGRERNKGGDVRACLRVRAIGRKLQGKKHMWMSVGDKTRSEKMCL